MVGGILRAKSQADSEKIALQANGPPVGITNDGARNGSLEVNRIAKLNGLPSSTDYIFKHSSPRGNPATFLADRSFF